MTKMVTSLATELQEKGYILNETQQKQAKELDKEAQRIRYIALSDASDEEINQLWKTHNLNVKEFSKTLSAYVTDNSQEDQGELASFAVFAGILIAAVLGIVGFTQTKQ